MMSRRAIPVGGRRLSALARVGFCLALLVALLVRGLTPTGFMPTTNDKDGLLTVAMCSGMGAVQVLPVPGSATAPKKQAEHDRCPFAPAPAFAAFPGAQTIAPPAYTAMTVSRPPLAHAFVEGVSRWPNAPPTGPPLLV